MVVYLASVLCPTAYALGTYLVIGKIEYNPAISVTVGSDRYADPCRSVSRNISITFSSL